MGGLAAVHREAVWAALNGAPSREQAAGLAAAARHELEEQTMAAIDRGLFSEVGELVDAGELGPPIRRALHVA